MEVFGKYIVSFIETSGIFSPLLFISFHLIRPLFFLPVIFICVSGGILFGLIAGTIYSVIGITLSSVLFYFIISFMPKTFSSFVHVKNKLFNNDQPFTMSQITLLRLIPFIHFHLICIYLIEITPDIKQYTRVSLLSSVPYVLLYTSMGHWISSLSYLYIFPLTVLLMFFIYFMRTKEKHIKWQKFFQLSA